MKNKEYFYVSFLEVPLPVPLHGGDDQRVHRKSHCSKNITTVTISHLDCFSIAHRNLQF